MDFDARIVSTSECSYFVRIGGAGPALLLLHGFPETHLMWRDVGPVLAQTFTVVCADLRGYGESGCPRSTPDHFPYSKRAMAADLVSAMAQLGHSSFAVAGHDRGGRVAYRMALDHPDKISRLAVLDILPTSTVWDRADAKLALSFWPWSLLAQPAPLPERLIEGAADAIIANAVGQWGSRSDAFSAEVREAYVNALRDPHRIHAICEEYRAAATIDREHDAFDQEAGKKISCPVLALWSGDGALHNWYAGEGGPLGLWNSWATNVRGKPVSGGHFFPEESPQETATELREFFESAQ